jgi:hypothetical protein
MGFVRTMDEITENFLGTFEFYDAEMLTIFFESKIEIIKRLIPPPLEPTSEPIGMVFVASYPKTIQLGEEELQFKSSTYDPWGDVEIAKVIGAVYTVGVNTMLPGTVAAEVDQTEFIPYAYMKVDSM